MTTSAGIQRLGERLYGGGDTEGRRAYIAVGTGQTPPDPSDSELENEVARKRAQTSVSGNSVNLSAVLEPSEGNGAGAEPATIRELGIYKGDALIERLVLPEQEWEEKDETIRLEISGVRTFEGS